MENGKGYDGNYSINILDDVSDESKNLQDKTNATVIFKFGISTLGTKLFLLGSLICD